ncbi:Imm1 family immunity protein [Actinokineospora diospyrosa]|uniref:Immunity protein Imm1 n=1 Tax=Actinokineospora diospyrosa TaxID=103728 RepID=A0ABT1IE00_9PSEU|nr:Imm1 family immunity protein [Actinokineospora diospyrosa]MCP2270855.1 Immunity protein Imm1 [Actinokineospora diospyrosa]
MTTPDNTPGVFDITTLDGDPTPVLDAIRALPTNTTMGTAWWLHHITDHHDHCLTIGIHGDQGALTWDEEPHGTWIPEHGTNPTPNDNYQTPDGHPFTQLPCTEVPRHLVETAITEFITTRTRPTCTTWIPA